jgi:hypothetical protein
LLELIQPDSSVNGHLVRSGEKFVHNSTQNGEYRLCISLTDGVFKAVEAEIKQIKVDFRYQNEFRKGTRISLILSIAGTADRKKQQYYTEGDAKAAKTPQDDLQNAAMEFHFSPLKKRAKRINQLIDDIIAHQNYEREKEQKYKDSLVSLGSGFRFLVFV